MGKIQEHGPVKLVISIVYRHDMVLSDVLESLKRIFGEMDDINASLPFEHTDYYREEMGGELIRELRCFKRLHTIEDISCVKRATNAIEDSFKKNNRRTVNIDPGYITHAKLVLLTTKDYSHRIYLQNGIYAECTLCFKDGEYVPWSWTYPDYATKNIRNYFKRVRAKYIEDIRKIPSQVEA